MKRFRIHWSMRWGIRAIYFLIILGFLGYLGLGVFLKSKLAGDLLVKQLSRQAGRPVRIGSVTLDWLRGFHIVLKDVEVLSIGGRLPLVSCRTMVTTIDIWPFLSRREIIFKRILLEDGFLRLRRNKEGKWRGVFPVPVSPVSSKPEIRKPKKAKRTFVLFFPKVSLRKISIELTLETEGENKVYTLFLRRADTVGSRRSERIRGEAEGTLRLYKSPRKIGFKAKGEYALAPPYPFDVMVHLSGFSLEEIGNFLDPKPRWRFEGMSQIILLGRGSVGESFNFNGSVLVKGPRFTSPGATIKVLRERSEFIFEGKGGGILKGVPKTFTLKVTTPAVPVDVRLYRKRRRIFARQGAIRNLVLKTRMALAERQMAVSVECDYHVGNGGKAEKPAHLKIDGEWVDHERPKFTFEFLSTRIPVKAIADGWRETDGKGETSISADETGTPPEIGSPPLRVIDRVEGKIVGKGMPSVSILSSRFSLAWGKSKVAFRIGPFQVKGKGPVKCTVTGEHIDPIIARVTPYIFDLFPPRVRTWIQAFRGGEISAFEGEVMLARTALGRLQGAKVVRADVKMMGLSFLSPMWSLQVQGMTGRVSYRAPSLEVTGLKAHVNDSLDVSVARLKIRDLFKKPMVLSGEGRIDSEGTDLAHDVLPPELARKTRISLPRGWFFTPGFFSGGIEVQFSGTLSPFSAENYKVGLNDVFLRGALSQAKGSNQPVTLTANATITPENIKVAHTSLKTSFGTMISEGSARCLPSGAWKLNAKANGRVSLENATFSSLFSRSKSLRMTGRTRFALKAQGVWPQLTIQGNLDGRELFCSYKDIFIKDLNVPASVDFQIDQTGTQSCELTWIRTKLKGFIFNLWGNLSSFNPLRGKINCKTNNHQLQRLMSLFPRFCKGKQCLLSKGDIQCAGWIELKEPLLYEMKAILANVSLPFPGEMEPISVAKATFQFTDGAVLLDIRNALYRESYVPHIKLKGKRQLDQWFWDTRLEIGFLDLDDIISKIHLGSKKTKDSPKEPEKDLIAKIIGYLHDRFIKGSISVQRLKILGYNLTDLFTRFHQNGKMGTVKGFNFLTKEGYGAIDVAWQEVQDGVINLNLSPLVKDLDFGKILDGILHRPSPFRGWLSFSGKLTSEGGNYKELKDALDGHLNVTYTNGVITHWAVLTSIFQLLDIYDIITLKNLPGISTGGLAYNLIQGTIQVTDGVASTHDAHLESQPFFMSGEGSLNLHNNQVSLLIGVYPFKMLDSFVSHIPIVGRIFTNKDKKFIGYFFKAEGDVKDPKVTSVNVKKLGKRIWDTFKKIITLPFYPFQDHNGKEETKK